MKKTYVFHIITILSFGISTIALYNAYMCLPIPKTYILASICIIGLYLVAVWMLNRKLTNRKKILFQSVALHIIPIIMSILLLLLIPKLQPIPKGTINDFEKTFCDMQRVQIRTAKTKGIKPFERRDEAKTACIALIEDNKLSKLSSNSDYYVRNLTHSLPYLVPEAKQLIVDIAATFQEISGTKSRFEITSVLRTKEDIVKLQQHNTNATTNSCHCYGTTFDISYASFKIDILNPKSNKELRMALSEAIHNLRKEGRCYVKFESAQKCYHITVR